MLKADLNIVGSKLMAIDVFSPSGLGGALWTSLGTATASTENVLLDHTGSRGIGGNTSGSTFRHRYLA